MKTAAFLSILSALATAFLLTTSAGANLALPHVEVHSRLAHEEVEVKITGDTAEVTGTFSYTLPPGWYSDLKLYLPVYAAEGTPVEDFTPDITLEEQKLDVRFIKKEWEKGSDDIKAFGELPQLEGQRVHWFMVPHVPQQPALTEKEKGIKKFILKIRYTQKLSHDKFIYTPLIPNEVKQLDYGTITVSADKPLMLIDEDQHVFEKVKRKYVIKPSDKRAIIVQVAKVTPQIP